MISTGSLSTMRRAAIGTLAASAAGLALVAVPGEGAAADGSEQPVPAAVSSERSAPAPVAALDPDDCPACGLG